MNTRKRNKNSLLDKHDDNRDSTIKWILQARSSILLLGYTQYNLYLFPPNKI